MKDALKELIDALPEDIRRRSASVLEKAERPDDGNSVGLCARAKRLRSSKDGEGEDGGKGAETKPGEELKNLPAEGLLAALNNKMQEISHIVRTIRSIVWDVFLIVHFIALTVSTIWLIVQGLKPLEVVAVALMVLFS